MRRKSSRNSARKPSPEKSTKEDVTRTRRSRRRKRSSSESAEEEEQPATPAPQGSQQPPAEGGEEEEEPVWTVTPTEAPKGEVQKLKICLTRPSPDSPEKQKARRSKSGSSHTEDDEDAKTTTPRRRTRRGGASSRNEDEEHEEEEEEEEEQDAEGGGKGKGKGKSKGKHKSKSSCNEKASENEMPQANTMTSEISENAQVTPQSPTIDKHDSEKIVNDDDDDTAGTAQRVPSDAGNRDDDDQPPIAIKDGGGRIEEGQSAPCEEAAATSEVEQSAEEVAPPEKTELRQDQVEAQQQQNTVEREVSPEVDRRETSGVTAEEAVEEDSQKSEGVVETNDSDVKTSAVGGAGFADGEQPAVERDGNKSPASSVEENNHKSIPVEEGKTPPHPQSVDVGLKDATDEVIADKQPRQKLKRNISYDNDKPCSIKRKPSWSNGWDASGLLESVIKIDLETVQTLCASTAIEYPIEPDLAMEKERRRSSTTTAQEAIRKLDRKVSVEFKDELAAAKFSRQVSTDSSSGGATTATAGGGGGQESGEERANIIAFNRKISIVDDTASKLKPPPSPAKNPTSDVLFITNLVRPFTLKQLKELLERTGKIVEGGFWTDRIKSKCYVQYESLEEAEATRNALHGVQWPIGNGKMLVIDYANAADLEAAKNPPIPSPPIAEVKAAVKENVEPLVVNKLKNDVKTESDKKINRKNSSEKPVREWDIGKRQSRSKERERERSRKHRRSLTPTEDFISKKQRKAEEAIPQKMMDDLFLKTKATPSIYWQPLSPEEISMKQQQRLIRMEEHKRRMEENSRSVRTRDVGRSGGGFRRNRYD